MREGGCKNRQGNPQRGQLMHPETARCVRSSVTGTEIKVAPSWLDQCQAPHDANRLAVPGVVKAQVVWQMSTQGFYVWTQPTIQTALCPLWRQNFTPPKQPRDNIRPQRSQPFKLWTVSCYVLCHFVSHSHTVWTWYTMQRHIKKRMPLWSSLLLKLVNRGTDSICEPIVHCDVVLD